MMTDIRTLSSSGRRRRCSPHFGPRPSVGRDPRQRHVSSADGTVQHRDEQGRALSCGGGARAAVDERGTAGGYFAGARDPIGRQGQVGRHAPLGADGRGCGKRKHRLIVSSPFNVYFDRSSEFLIHYVYSSAARCLLVVKSKSAATRCIGLTVFQVEVWPLFAGSGILLSAILRPFWSPLLLLVCPVFFWAKAFIYTLMQNHSGLVDQSPTSRLRPESRFCITAARNRQERARVA